MQKYFSFISDDLVRSAVALSGGGGRATIGSCGAYSGGLMALSARFSPISDILSVKEVEELDLARRKFNEFRDWFITEFSSVVCRDVQLKLFGRFFNFMDEQERQAFREFQEAQDRSCRPVYTQAALKVAEILTS